MPALLVTVLLQNHWELCTRRLLLLLLAHLHSGLEYCKLAEALLQGCNGRCRPLYMLLLLLLLALLLLAGQSAAT
jgi:hypothetical protein